MKKDFNVIIEKDEDGFYVATVPALKGCHTQAKSLDVLIERTKEAIELCLEDQIKPIYPIDFIGVQKITVNEKSSEYDVSKIGRKKTKKESYRASRKTSVVHKSVPTESKARTR